MSVQSTYKCTCTMNITVYMYSSWEDNDCILIDELNTCTFIYVSWNWFKCVKKKKKYSNMDNILKHRCQIPGSAYETIPSRPSLCTARLQDLSSKVIIETRVVIFVLNFTLIQQHLLHFVIKLTLGSLQLSCNIYPH